MPHRGKMRGLPDDFLLPPPATEMELDGSWGSLGQPGPQTLALQFMKLANGLI